MKALLEISFLPVNAFFSVMSALMIIYWILVIVSGIDPDLFSIDFDVSDVHAGPGSETGSEGSGFMKALEYFSFDELPLMLILTIIFFTMWFLGVNITYYSGLRSTTAGLLFIVPDFIVSLFVVRLVSKPIGFIYRKFNHKGEPEIDFLGRRCTTLSTIHQDKTGQVRLMVNGDPLKVYARSNSAERLEPGREAIITGESEDKKYFLIEKFDY